MANGSSRFKRAGSVRVVSHHPWRQPVLLLAVAALCLAGAMGGYWFGRATAGLDGTYLLSMRRLNDSNQQAIADLQARLVESELAREVDQEAAGALKDDIRSLKDEVAALTEEVTFYKSLMAPSSVARGLQIADFELFAMEEPRRYRFHLLLTQVESRRDWVQGDVTLEVHGRTPAAAETAGSDSATEFVERVLPLTEIAEEGAYPLKFRFRYFQDLTGVINLPAGFEPERIVVKAGKRGASTEPLNRTFDWSVAG